MDILNTEGALNESSELRLNAKDLVEVTSHFSGLKPDGTPKAFLNYSAYDFDVPEDDIDKNTISSANPVRIELCLDRMTGFYIMDIIFQDENDISLKLLWAKLQKHKSNETYLGDKMWIFFIKLIENLSDDELEHTTGVYSADILNPLCFYLIRTIPDQKVEDYEVEPGVFSGGNTIRLLLHSDLVTFQYEDMEDDEARDIETIAE